MILQQEAINTVVQVSFALLIAGAFWLIFARKRAGFRHWTGLHGTSVSALVWSLAILALLLSISYTAKLVPDLAELARGENTVVGSLMEQASGSTLWAAVVLTALFKTALSEEIVFRGLLAKRLINALGFWSGNTLHALLFGLVHWAIFLIPGGPAFDPALAAGVLLLPGFAGWMMAFANEKLGQGSLVPGWIIHGLGNLIGYSTLIVTTQA